MNFAEISFVFLLSAGTAVAVPLAELTGEPSPELLDQYLQVSITGNVGVSPDASHLDTGYWTSASVTGGSSSAEEVYTTITFTATGLGASESLDLTGIKFDYTRATLNGSNPVMEVYVDTGGGYEDPVLLVNDEPSSSLQTDPQSIILSHSLKNGESISFGFSYADRHGLVRRTHMIDNFVLEGTYDLESTQAGIDINNNGVSDIWEYRYGASDLVKDALVGNQDFDGDGFSNLQEALTGTNPFKADSRLELFAGLSSDSKVQLQLPSVLGKEYQLYGSETLVDGSWEPSNASFEGDGGMMGFEVDPDVFERYFYKVEVTDVDEDGDRLTRWEERNVAGFDDSDTASTTSGAGDDYQQMKGLVQSALEASVTITAGAKVVYEDGGGGLPITFTRVSERGNGFLDLQRTQSFQLIDITEVASNAASAEDYRLVDENGEIIWDGVVHLGAGEVSKTIYLEALADGVIENDEQLTLSVMEHGSLNLWIKDAEELASEDFIALSRAGHFLSQASMGGTPAEIAELANKIQNEGYLPACEAWIDEQITMPRESSVTDDCLQHQLTFLGGEQVPSINIQNFELVWWGKVTQSREQLRHRMAFSLSQIFVTSSTFWANSERHNVWRSYTGYYDKLMDEAFSTHRDLLSTISYDPFMGVYLSSAQNRKGDEELGTFPDENYAREVMQLFSCGVYAQDQSGNYLLDFEGNRIENYDNGDITEMAKVFTGLGLTDSSGEAVNFNSPGAGNGTRYENPMVMVEEYHDTSEKVLLDGTVLPEDRSGDSDIAAALDSLASHSSTAPHLSRLLIKRLTSSNPSDQYIARVTEAWRGEGVYGRGVHGDFVAVLKAILLDPEVRYGIDYQLEGSSGEVRLEPTRAISGRIKEPILKWTQFYRFSQALSGESDGLIRVQPKTKKAANDQTPDFGQIPLRAPSVFNFYDSDYSPSLGALAEAEVTYNRHLTSPESEILSPYVIKQFESFHAIVDQDRPLSSFSYLEDEFSINYSYLSYLYQKNESIEGFIDDLNIWLCNGQISKQLKDELVDLSELNGGATRENFSKVLSILFNASDFSVSY
ncbi:DUF1800 family protein [Rubritalea spongiae]|uniref:DUF1800 family protein n=1 Tax=Rubritalea spongiae TaxID=430797 RepID=A0ABW5E2Z4_9BACT